jgi:hypothetical protein
MKLSINGLYNLGRAEKGGIKLFMSGTEIVSLYEQGAYKSLGNLQKGKLRKIARRISMKKEA